MSTSSTRGSAVIATLQRYNTSPIVFIGLVLGTVLGAQTPGGAFAGALSGVAIGVLAKLTRTRVLRPAADQSGKE